MSESDSDLEFESADEDTEENCSEKCETVSKHESDCDKEIVTVKILSVEGANKETKQKNVPPSEIEPEVKEGPCPVKQEPANPKSELVKANEKQRITLRLEKKLQKKNSSKECSTENFTRIDESPCTSPVLQSPEESKPMESSWGFGSWGTSLLTTFTTQVSQGIGTVLETVESGLGVPAPEQLANQCAPAPDCAGGESQDVTREEKLQAEPKSSLLGDVSSWTRALEDTGSKLLFGGLDTLELIGRKTIDILTEGDPGLRKKRAAISEHLTLSQILREAKEEASQGSGASDSTDASSSPNYSQMLDDYRGLAHLEALEMLSKQSKARVQRAPDAPDTDSPLGKSLEQIRGICADVPTSEELPESEDFETLLRQHMLQIDLPFSIDSILQVRKRINDSTLFDQAVLKTKQPKEVYSTALHSLAEFTARCMETFHKLAELLLVRSGLSPNCTTHLTGLATAMCMEVNNLATKYQHSLEAAFMDSEDTNITVIVTNLYVEAENSNWYIWNAFQLLVPVLQECVLSMVE